MPGRSSSHPILMLLMFSSANVRLQDIARTFWKAVMDLAYEYLFPFLTDYPGLLSSDSLLTN